MKCFRTPVEEFRTRCTYFALLHFCWPSLCRQSPTFWPKLPTAPQRIPRRIRRKALPSSAAGQAQQSAAETAGQLSVQQRIGQRRAQRRATAIHDAYDHKWELDGGTGYLRFQPGPNLQRLTYYAWDVSATRFHSERLGYTLDGRGYYGYAFVGVNQYSQGAFTRPEISMYNVLGGPIYRFYLQPRFAVSGRVLGGWAYGNFGGDVSTATPTRNWPLSQRQHLCGPA